MNPLAPYMTAIKAIGGLALLAALAWGAYKIHDSIWQDGYNAANIRAEQVIAEFARAEAEAQAAARRAEQRSTAAMARVDEAYQLGRDDAQRSYDDTVAGLTAGNLQLQDHWRASVATCNLSATAAATRERDAAIQVQRESAGRIVQAVRECDAQGNAAIAVIEAMGQGRP